MVGLLVWEGGDVVIVLTRVGFEVRVLALFNEPCVSVVSALIMLVPRWSVCEGVWCRHDYFMPPPIMRDDMCLRRVSSWFCMLAMRSLVSSCLQCRSLIPSKSDLTSAFLSGFVVVCGG